MDVTRRLFGLDGRSAAVVGATPVGAATVRLFEEAGARALLLPTVHEGDGEALDPCDEAAVGARLDALMAEQDGLDVFVYAVTTPGTYPFGEMTLAQWDRLQAANLRGAFVCLREAVRRMVPRGGGRLVAVSTMGALHPVLNGNAAYGASKAGLNAMVRSIALDHAADGIRANALLCGAVPVGPAPPDAGRSAGPAFQPGRLMLGMAEPEAMAAAVLYLASPAGGFITGQSLVADGGFLIS
ncbi:MAG: SDR family oxidoreductase [Caulobacterales bacterium]|nr:SDR family oxidoreductase [Caulobacterales bacterium]